MMLILSDSLSHQNCFLIKCTMKCMICMIQQMERAQRQYILTQGPLPNTVSHFWLMVWEQNSKAIIMLNKVIEKNQVKCHQYWPLDSSSDHTMTFPDVDLKVEYVSKTESLDYTICTLR
jgi:tyrosine-protein phosphatase non-receptor type 1